MRLLDLPNDLALTLDAENLSDIDAATDLPLDAALAIDTAPRVRNGAEALLDTLVACGVDTIFGYPCLLYTSPSPRDLSTSRMPSSA